MFSTMTRALALCLLMAIANPVLPADDPAVQVNIVYVGRDEEPRIPLSLLDLYPEDEGVLGAQLGLNDNQTTGDFLGHKYNLQSVLVAEEEDIADRVPATLTDTAGLIIADLEANDLLALADAVPDALLINIRARDDRLRNEDCRANVFHVAPSRSMLADGLVQYLVWKRWDELVLVTGRHEVDALFASALKRAAGRFGVEIVEEKDWTAVPGARRTDSGHHSLQQEVPVFSRFKEHDVVLVADEMDEFGEYLPYRTSEPRVIAGTQGLIGSAWHRTQEQWGATQIQRRFIKLADRIMTPRDYAGWAAMRSIGEAVTQTASAEVADIREFILSDKFNLAGFKGVPLTYRNWNGQLRQPVLVVGARMLVSVSPQDGFLHPTSVLDTLGYDEPETGCQVFKS